jgi:hypothetical protein
MNAYFKYKQRSPIPDQYTAQSDSHHLSQILSNSHSPQYSLTSFTKGIFLPYSDKQSEETNLIRYKFDTSYYHVLKEINWNVFVTLKFRTTKYSGLSYFPSSRRKHFLRDLGHEVIGELDLSSNDLQYFWSQEVNSDKQAHLHVLFHRVRPEKCSVEELRASIERYIDPDIAIVPKKKDGHEPPHVQTVRSQDRAVRYLLKIPFFQTDSKVVGHSFGFVRFWNRHWNWKRKQAA